MAVPVPVGTPYAATFGTSSSWQLAIGPLTAGNTVLIAVIQTQSTPRTITSLSDGTNSYAELVTRVGAGFGANVHMHGHMAVAGVGAVTLTVTWSANTQGRLVVQEFTPCTDPAITDTQQAGTNSLNHLSAATGLNPPNGDVLLFAVGGLNGGGGTLTEGSGYTPLDMSALVAVQYRTSSSPIGGLDQGPFTTTINRAERGVMAAFYAAGGGGSPSALPLFIAHYRSQGIM